MNRKVHWMLAPATPLDNMVGQEASQAVAEQTSPSESDHCCIDMAQRQGASLGGLGGVASLPCGLIKSLVQMTKRESVKRSKSHTKLVSLSSPHYIYGLRAKTHMSPRTNELRTS